MILVSTQITKLNKLQTLQLLIKYRCMNVGSIQSSILRSKQCFRKRKRLVLTLFDRSKRNLVIMARPPKDNPKNKVIGFRVTSEEYSQIREKAKKSGVGSHKHRAEKLHRISTNS